MATVLSPALWGLLLGSAVQLQQSALFDRGFYQAFVATALALCAVAATKKLASKTFYRFAWSARGGLVLLAFAMLGFGATGWRASSYCDATMNPALEGKDVLVTGIVASLPQRSEGGLRWRMLVESAHWQGQAVQLPRRIYLSWYSGILGGNAADAPAQLQHQPAPLRPGERWRMLVRLKAPHGSVNPFGFDYELWMWEQGLQATGYVRAGVQDPLPQRLQATWHYPMDRLRLAVRERIEAHVSDRQQAGWLAALVMGDQNAIDKADWDVFRATGVAHLMSISGLHITLFGWLAAQLVGWLWRRSEALCLQVSASAAALTGSVLLAGFYAWFSGGGVPAQRTVLMLACVVLLRLSGRRWPWPQVWLLACAVVVALDPWALLQAGFWLSFVAVGILFATQTGAHYAGSTGFTGRIRVALREQWVITVALAPLTLLLFGQVSLVSLVANALAIPWVTLVITPLALLGVALTPLWDLACAAIALLAWYLQVLSSWPWATWTVAQAPLWAGVAGVLGGVALTLPWPWSLRALGLPLILPVLLWRSPTVPPGEFELLAADIGQGNAVLVRTAQHVLLYDAGPRFNAESDAGNRVLVPLLHALDWRVDRVVLSHRDADHTGGALAVLLMNAQAELMSSIENDHALQAVRAASRCVAGQRWHWDGVEFEVLHPLPEHYARPARTNALSCVLRVGNAAHSALLVGDIEQAQEQQLIARTASLQADVLLVPHHGSKSSSSTTFLQAVSPRWAFVQAGYRNHFGHPAEPVVERYREQGIALVSTPACGAITWQSVRPQTVECEREKTRRYWRHQLPSAP